jgi:gamma-glutamylcyclotransferase (GGCT)/AIG2-like uncharacterized protein YtfP
LTKRQRWGPSQTNSPPVARDSSLLFVYGTLQRGFSRHRFLKAARAQFLSRGTIRARLFNLGDYPGATPSRHPGQRVQGEVYRLPKPDLAFRVLDVVEGCRPAASTGEYRRGLTLVVLDDGTTVTAWVYWLNRPRGAARPIRPGIYSSGSRCHRG